MAALGLPLAASAHALAQSSDPADGATVQQAPGQVVITFGQTPDPRLSSITVVNTSGTSYDAGPTQAVPGNPLQLEVALKPLPRGVYTVTWETVSTVDGHRAAGAFAFGVGEAPGAAADTARGAVQSPPPSALAVAGRVLLFVGLLLMVGVASTSLLALAEVPAFAPLLMLLGWGLSALGTAGVIEAERESARISWGALFSTSLGVTVGWRIAATVVAGLAAAFVMIPTAPRWRRIAVAVAGLAAAAGMWVDVAASHAGGEAPVAVNLLLQFVHVVAAGIWIGGLFVLLLAVRGAVSEVKARAARRFSTLALLAIVVLAATGVIRAVLEIQSWHQLVASPFGQLVLVKVGLLVLLIGLGAVNRFSSVPRAGTSLGRLRRVASTEVVAGVAALLVTAALVNNSPPVEAASGSTVSAQQQPAAVVVSGSDYATTIRLRLQVTPGTAGFNRFTAWVSDYDTGRPITGDQVVLQFSMPLRPDIGPSSLTLAGQRDGTYQARGGNLSVNGTWSITALVQGKTSAATVQLQLATVQPAPIVAVQRFAGSPTLYTIQLSQGRSVQVYVDPDKPGADEFHVTFLDPRAPSGEMTITSAAVAMTPPGGAAQVLSLRRLDPNGHFVADIQVPTGKSRYDILGTTSAGEQISTYIEIAPGT